MNKVRMLIENLGSGASAKVVTYRGRRYVVTSGTGENNFGASGGGSAAFAYAISDLRVAALRGDEWDYSAWCNTISTVEDIGLARMLARSFGQRLAHSGSCDPVLDDAAWLEATK